jgi:cytochrome c553
VRALALSLSFALAVGLVAEGNARPAGPAMPGPATADYARGSREADDAACVKCHGAIATEHGRSLHAKSWSDPSFQRGLAIEPKAF